MLEATCDVCGCVFLYTLDDAKISYAMNGNGVETHAVCRYVMCPECLAHPVVVYEFPKRNEDKRNTEEITNGSNR